MTPLEGQDLLLEALVATAGLPWRGAFVGSPDRDPPFAAELERRAADGGIAHRLRWAGVLTGADLAREYRDADLLVLPSRTEAYGMVVTEALAAGVPGLLVPRRIPARSPQHSSAGSPTPACGTGSGGPRCGAWRPSPAGTRPAGG
jgi:glycosyltransferase involved in cell wall biosynthesis